MGMDRTIKMLRKQARLSQKDVAQALGVGQSAVSHWENGDVQPSTDKIPKLARVLGVTEQELFGEQDAGGSTSLTTQENGYATASLPAQVFGHASMDLAAQGLDRKASRGTAKEATPDSPYLRSLELAVMHARPAYDTQANGDGTSTVPLVTLEKAGSGEALAEELVGQSVEVPASVLRDHPSAQALVMKGDCMNRIAGDGTMVVFDPDLEPTNGRIAIVEAHNHEVIVRRWHKGTDKLMLSADSYVRYSDIVIDDVRTIRVLGTVVYIVTPQNML